MEVLLFSFYISLLSIPFFRKTFFYKREMEKRETKRSRNLFFDYIKGVSILAVIIIHLSDFYLKTYVGNLFFIFINNISRFAVPVFLISSGALLGVSSSSKSFREYFKKKFIRIFLPYILITIFVGLLYEEGCLEIIKAILGGNASTPYYFISVLGQLYLIYYFISKYKEKKYFLEIAFVFSFLFTLYKPAHIIFGIPTFFKFFFFFAYGMNLGVKYLSEKIEEKKDEKYYWGFLVLVFVVFTLFSGQYVYNARLFYAIAVFNLLFIFKDFLKKYFFYKELVFVGQHSLWIFLFHYFIVNYISSILIPAIKFIPFSFAAAMILSSLFSILVAVFFAKYYKKIINILCG